VPADSPQITTIPPQIHHQKPRSATRFFKNPQQKRQKFPKEKMRVSLY
jgi:hypothetical protein